MLERAPFSILDLVFEARFERPLELPPYAGGTLRGAYGAALRQLACMTGHQTCEGCALRATCPYPALFEPPPRDLSPVGLPRLQEGVPPPFILRIPERDAERDGRLSFGMRLVGTAIGRLAFVIEAWRRAVKRGIGWARIRGELVAVRHGPDGPLLWSGEAIDLPAIEPIPLLPSSERFSLISRTPLRLYARGQPLPLEQITPRAFVAAIIRRARLLTSHATPDEQETVRSWPVDRWLTEADLIEHRRELVWQDWHRFSGRQHRRMNLGGYVGHWTWTTVPQPIQQLVALASLIHVGKEASFGLGAVEVLPLR